MNHNSKKYFSVTTFIILMVAAIFFMMGYQAGVRHGEENAHAKAPKETQRSKARQVDSTKPFKRRPPVFSVNDVPDKDKKEVIVFAYKALEKYFDPQTELPPISKDNFFHKLKYSRLFVTLTADKRLRGCMSVSVPKKDKKSLENDIIASMNWTIEDERFGGALRAGELSEAKVMLTFMHDRKKMSGNNYRYLRDNIAPGIHAIELRKGKNAAFFKETIQIEYNWYLKKTLEELSRKAGLGKDGWQKADIYKLNTITFGGSRGGDVINYYRYDFLLGLDEIDQDLLSERIRMAGDWFLNNTNVRTGLLEYQYSPSENRYSPDNNHIRQMACLWGFTALAKFLQSTEFDFLIKTTLDHYLRHRVDKEDYSYLAVNTPEDARIAYNAFLLMALLNIEDYPNREELIDRFARGIVRMQKPNGSFVTNFVTGSTSGIEFYPGEAMLALMKVYHQYPNKEYIDCVQNSIGYHKNYWEENKKHYFVSWFTQAYAELYQYTKDPKLAEFIFEMNSWSIDNFQIQSDPEFADQLGGFIKNRQVAQIYTSSCMESINSAYRVAVLAGNQEYVKKFEKSIKLGTRFVLQCQFTPENSFYVKNPAKAIGGFKFSLTRNGLRNDGTQHALFALLKAHQNRIFE